MNDFIMDFMRFVGWQIKRFMEKDAEGWHGAKDIYEDEYRERAIKNLRMGDYVDAANLCFLAAWAKARGQVRNKLRIIPNYDPIIMDRECKTNSTMGE